jgi:uncharacterized membrane protein YjjB (DUF3815 family)
MEIIGVILMVPGFLAVYLAKYIVEKYRLNEKVVCDFEGELTEEELAMYKLNKAILNIKMTGMIIMLPGLFLFIVGTFMK